ncbi:inosine-uridine preferring nucleoside hydrolase [Microcaecilia unicolor]|uniref:Inosine-uridine preferring nucleoside hydrolase-like n=1 Tax=Microcaecilia unicolor TaxID=1415580 RepID=A0A6P7XY69_9AMPH|nr:inosine-uridine preferring nucleoside hydrolase-like [Microcaecilia unicolor]
MAKKLLVVDVDCGVDDAQAIMMALASPSVEILGITCCFGNTSIENVCRNVLHVLKVCNRTEIPVFRGASDSLLGGSDLPFLHFGGDGLGDVPDQARPGLENLQGEHAVQALLRIISEHAGQICLVATGPLTNLALAVKLDPTFPQKLKHLYIMGGNMDGTGNRSMCAEFNFSLDPEAAHIVLNQFLCPTYIATLQFTYNNSLSMDFFKDLVNQNTMKARFMKKITSQWSHNKSDFVSYDSYAMAAAIDESVITDYLACSVSVELNGQLTRGMLVLDVNNRQKKTHKAFLMKRCDLEKFKKLLMLSLQ